MLLLFRMDILRVVDLIQCQVSICLNFFEFLPEDEQDKQLIPISVSLYTYIKIIVVLHYNIKFP